MVSLSWRKEASFVSNGSVRVTVTAVVVGTADSQTAKETSRGEYF